MKINKFFTCVLSLLLMSNIAFAATKNTVKNSKVSPLTVEISRLLENGNYKSADMLLSENLRRSPSNAELHILSAISNAMQDKIDMAQDELNSVKKVSLNNADFYYAQGVIYLKRVDTSDMRFRAKTEDLIQLTVNQLQYALKINPNHDRAYNALGVAELKRNNLFQAEQYFKSALKINPDYATATDNLGSVYYLTNELDAAMTYYKKAVLLNPSSSTVNYHLAQVALKKNDLNTALYYANKSLLWNKKSPYTYNLIGEIYRRQGNEAAAINSFKKSIFCMPEYSAPYSNLASIYQSRGDAEFAIEELKTCYSVNPYSDESLLDLADLSLLIGQYNDAIKYYSQVSDKYKKESVEGLVTAYYGLSTISSNKSLFRSNQNLNDALKYINEAIKVDPNNLELYLTKAKIVKMTQNPMDSRDVLEKIVSAPNTNLGDLIIKGDAYCSLQRYRDARNTYTQAVKTPKSIDDDLYLAELFTYNKQFRMAKDSLQNVLNIEPNNSVALNNWAYILKSEETSNQYYKNARYFKKHHNDKFFQKVYLNKALRHNPNNINANMMLAKLLVKEGKYENYVEADKCYRTVLGASDRPRQIRRVAKKVRKLDKKIAKMEAKRFKKLNKHNGNLEDIGTPPYIQNVNVKTVTPVSGDTKPAVLTQPLKK